MQVLPAHIRNGGGEGEEGGGEGEEGGGKVEGLLKAIIFNYYFELIEKFWA